MTAPDTTNHMAPVLIRWASERHLRIELRTDRDAGGDVVGQVAGQTSGQTAGKIAGIAAALRDAALPGVLDIVPAYRTVLVHLDPASAENTEAAILEIARSAPPIEHAASRLVEIPVCYDPAFAIDLESVATACGLLAAEIVRLHASAEYRVQFLGFSPGFAYLAGLPAAIHTPRLASPRPRIPAGSVAIASDQAGIYPRETSGGWRIIGRTPRVMFDATRDPASLLGPGDRVRFVPITSQEFGRFAGAAR